MKKLLVILISTCNYCLLYAQSDVKKFVPYSFSIPGSQLECKMVPVKAGSFVMGSGVEDKEREKDESPQRTVFISAFWMGAYEVTRDEFDFFYNDPSVSANSKADAVTRPSPQYVDLTWGMGKEGGYPVNSLSQQAALMYCRWLYNKTGVFYRLPTEAEWEYACRAGSTTRFYFGNDEQQLDQYAWYKNNSNNKFQKTGTKLPNAWGLYDMLGNVAEWTLDHYAEERMKNMADKTKDPVAAAETARYPKVVRGGSYADAAADLRSANRFPSDPSWNRRDPQIPKSRWWLTDAPGVGFRIVQPLVQPTAEEAEAFFKQYLGK